MIPDYIFKSLLKDKSNGEAFIAHLKKNLKISKKMRKERKLLDNQPGISERYTYDLENKSSDFLPGKLIRSEDTPASGDPAVDEAHSNHEKVRNFLLEVLGRDSFDNLGGDLHGSVHVEENMDNAFWNGSQMAYGDGLIFQRLTKSLDVAAHEISHGLIQHTADMIYFFEPGAVNEHYADVLGVVCKQYINHQTIINGNWLVGDDIVTDRFPGEALRTFTADKAYKTDPQPKHKRNQYYGFQDNGGVHINSGIPNHAFYLFCLNYVEVVGEDAVSWEAPLLIWYRALAHLHRFSGLGDLKKATMKVCKVDYKYLLPALEDAWKGVGM